MHSIVIWRPPPLVAACELRSVQVISVERSNLAQTAVVFMATFAALLLLGLVLAYWTWVWFAPVPESRAPAVADTVGRVTSASGLFGSAQRGQNDAAPTGVAIRLLGVVAATAGKRGYAVVELETREILAVREGDDVIPGIRLAEVHADHVILERNGTRETLVWPSKSSAGISASPISK